MSDPTRSLDSIQYGSVGPDAEAVPDTGLPIPKATLDRLLASLAQVQRAYFRVVWLVSPRASLSSALVQAAAKRHHTTPINLGIRLAEPLASLPSSGRRAQLNTLLDQLCNPVPAAPVFLDHMELLFEPSLTAEVGKLLERLSRGTCGIVAVWPGRFSANTLEYAEPGHPEHQRHVIGSAPCLQLTHDLLILATL